MRRIGLVAATCVVVAGALALTPAAATPAPTAQRPLQGLTIALDPGHQLGNSNPRFASQLAKTKFNGLRIKGCNINTCQDKTAINGYHINLLMLNAHVDLANNKSID